MGKQAERNRMSAVLNGETSRTFKDRHASTTRIMGFKEYNAIHRDYRFTDDEGQPWLLTLDGLVQVHLSV